MIGVESGDQVTREQPLIVYIPGNPVSYEVRDIHNPLLALKLHSYNSQSNTVALLRPGYSSGSKTSAPELISQEGNIDRWDRPEVVVSLVDALQNLKSYFGAKKLVVVGEWDAATTTAIILGLRPKLVDAAILLHCPCDIAQWRDYYENRSKVELPKRLIDRISKKTPIVMMLAGREKYFTVPNTLAQTLSYNSFNSRLVTTNERLSKLIFSDAIKNEVYSMTLPSKD